MGTKIALATEDESERIYRLLRMAKGWFIEWEQIFSRFLPGSELSSLNRRAGNWVFVSDSLWDVLRTALRGIQDTQGLVTPLILNALEDAGYDRSFEFLEPAVHAPLTTLPRNRNPMPWWHSIKINFEDQSLFLPEGVRLDLGGYVKGWAADLTARLLGEYSPTLVDAGGDIAISAPRLDSRPWQVAVSNPILPQGKRLCVLPIDLKNFPGRVGIATSSGLAHRWQQEGTTRHHLIDPRTGAPAQSDLLQVTVIAPSTLQAEIAAKAVYILGSEAGTHWLDRHPGYAGVLLYDPGED